MAELQGGQKVRVLLAQALFGRPEALLLDEPTNHLDLDSIHWVREFLLRYEGTLIVISHDRHFLNGVCTHTADIDYQTIITYTGGYDDMVLAKTQIRTRVEADNEQREKKIAQLQDFIQRFSAGTRASQVMSRKKEVERLQTTELARSNIQRPYIRFSMNRPSGRVAAEIKGISKAFRDLKVVEEAGGEQCVVVLPRVNDTLLHTDPGHHRLYYLSVPRDLQTEVPGHGQEKINAAMQFGGPRLAVQTLDALLGKSLPVNHVVIVDFNQFEKLIDAVGGITVNVPENILSNRFDCPYKTQQRCSQWQGWRFHKGPTHMDGHQALIFSRVRENQLNRSYTDFDRQHDQQLVEQATLAKLSSPMRFFSLPFTGDYSLAPIALQLDVPGVLRLSFLPVLLSLFLMAFLDTMGTLVGVGAAGGMLAAFAVLLRSLPLAVVGRVEARALVMDGDREEDELDGGGAALVARLRRRGRHRLEALEVVAVRAAVLVNRHEGGRR